MLTALSRLMLQSRRRCNIPPADHDVCIPAAGQTARTHTCAHIHTALRWTLDTYTRAPILCSSRPPCSCFLSSCHLPIWSVRMSKRRPLLSHPRTSCTMPDRFSAGRSRPSTTRGGGRTLRGWKRGPSARPCCPGCSTACSSSTLPTSRSVVRCVVSCSCFLSWPAICRARGQVNRTQALLGVGLKGAQPARHHTARTPASCV